MRTRSSGLLFSTLRGGRAGLLATAAMSLVMLLARRLGLTPTLPPERIVEEGAMATGTRAGPEQLDAAAVVAHLGFGAAGGAALGAASRVVGERAAATLAVPWALAIWAGSYFGWVPALGILPPPSKDHPGRAWTMLGAHLVYGGVLAAAWAAGPRGSDR